MAAANLQNWAGYFSSDTSEIMYCSEETQTAQQYAVAALQPYS